MTSESEHLGEWRIGRVEMGPLVIPVIYDEGPEPAVYTKEYGLQLNWIDGRIEIYPWERISSVKYVPHGD